jgi:hypothetical protein
VIIHHISRGKKGEVNGKAGDGERRRRKGTGVASGEREWEKGVGKGSGKGEWERRVGRASGKGEWVSVRFFVFGFARVF